MSSFISAIFYCYKLTCSPLHFYVNQSIKQISMKSQEIQIIKQIDRVVMPCAVVTYLRLQYLMIMKGVVMRHLCTREEDSIRVWSNMRCGWVLLYSVTSAGRLLHYPLYDLFRLT